jgi:carnitine O-acetyltransferase
VNWWCQLKDHPHQPKDLLIHPPPTSVITEFQITRAAGLVASLLDFKELLDQEKIEPDMSKEGPLCMNQYKNQFGTTRIPGNKCDVISTQHPCTSKFIVLSIRNQLYQIVVVNEKGKRASVKELKRLFYAASKDSLESEKQAPIGLMTAGHRDTAFEIYKKLSQSTNNANNLKIIQDAMFVLCLDDASAKKNLDLSHQQIFHNFNARNRWFDKAIQLIVAPNGRAGVNGEVSLFFK